MMTTNMAFKVVGKTHRDGELTITEGIGSQRMIPSRRFPVTMPRWERRRMQVTQRNHAGLVLYRLQQAKWDKESAE